MAAPARRRGLVSANIEFMPTLNHWTWSLMRQIVLDTETTGLEPEQGHRIIEIGCVELLERRLTGNNFHVYLQPDREIDAAAVEVHGITNEFLADKPRFADIAEDLIAYLKGAELVIHNAPFDVGLSGRRAGAGGRVRPDQRIQCRARHPGHGAQEASGATQQPRRAVWSIRCRQQPARQARRATGCGDSGRRLPGDDRWSAHIVVGRRQRGGTAGRRGCRYSTCQP